MNKWRLSNSESVFQTRGERADIDLYRHRCENNLTLHSSDNEVELMRFQT